LACPFFVPTQKLENGAWPHPSRLPLGAGWRGLCSAPGHEGAAPSEIELTEHCNLGYAAACPRLPAERSCDAVRFAMACDGGPLMTLWFVCEKEHRPGEHGKLEFDTLLARWSAPHPDPRIQKLAQCYLDSYVNRKLRGASMDLPSSAIHE
jgi:hypothetical protein